ncbi:hypothetical protein [Streptomyces sp. NPDC055085]
MSLLIVLLVPLSAVALWTGQISDTSQFVSLMAPLAHDRDIQDNVADRVTNEVIARSPAGTFSSPEDLATLNDAAQAYTRGPNFPDGWNAAMKATHGTFKQTLIGSSDSDSLDVNLGPIIEDVKSEMMNENSSLASQIPDTSAPTVLLQANSLEVLRGKLHKMSVLGIWVPIVTLILTAGSISVATQRIRAVMIVGISYAIGGAFTWSAVAIFGQLARNDLDSGVDRKSASTVYSQITSLMQACAYICLGVGLIMAIGAWLTLVKRARNSRMKDRREGMVREPDVTI